MEFCCGICKLAHADTKVVNKKICGGISIQKCPFHTWHPCDAKPTSLLCLTVTRRSPQHRRMQAIACVHHPRCRPPQNKIKTCSLHLISSSWVFQFTWWSCFTEQSQCMLRAQTWSFSSTQRQRLPLCKLGATMVLTASIFSYMCLPTQPFRTHAGPAVLVGVQWWLCQSHKQIKPHSQHSFLWGEQKLQLWTRDLLKEDYFKEIKQQQHCCNKRDKMNFLTKQLARLFYNTDNDLIDCPTQFSSSPMMMIIPGSLLLNRKLQLLHNPSGWMMIS